MVLFRKSLNARQTDMRIFDNVYRFTVQFRRDQVETDTSSDDIKCS